MKHNNFRRRQKHVQNISKYLLGNYSKDEDKLNTSFKRIYLNIIDNYLTIFESENYNIKKYRKQFNEIRNNLEGKIEVFDGMASKEK